MEEIAAFVGEGEGEVYTGIAKTFARVQKGLEEGRQGGDIDVLKKFVEGKKALETHWVGCRFLLGCCSTHERHRLEDIPLCAYMTVLNFS